MNHSTQIRALSEALDGVQVNAQALAAADLCLGTVISVRDQFNGWFASISPDRSLVDARDQLNGAISDVENARAPLVGMPAAPVGSDWDNLRHAIQRAYNVMWAVQDVQGEVDTSWGGFFSWLGETLVGSIEAMPGVIRSAVAWAGDLASSTAGNVVAGVLQGLWPVLLVVAVVAAGGVYLLGGRGALRLARGGL